MSRIGGAVPRRRAHGGRRARVGVGVGAGAGAGVLALFLLGSCATLRPWPVRGGETYAVLVNGGGSPRINYASHLRHVERLLAHLHEAGIPASRITVFASDGTDPAEDLATRDLDDEQDAWLLPAGLQRILRPPIEQVSSQVEGADLRPATREALERWFEEEGRRLGAGDTLLFYVTDHGEGGEDPPEDNTITLWEDEIDVGGVRDLLTRLSPGVRVVTLMSQCFSGGFAELRRIEDRPVCGYFSTTHDRLAYGCYPENRGRDEVGHSHHFFEALERTSGFPQAHRAVLVTDDTPDVPLRTSDHFLRRRLEHEAALAGESFAETVDRWLEVAWRNRGRWEPEIRLLDRIGRRFGFFSPRSLAEVEERRVLFAGLSDRLGTYAGRWGQSLEALRRETFEGFVESHPQWAERVRPAELRELDEEERRAFRAELLSELEPFVAARPRLEERLRSLRDNMEAARGAYYRAEVRLGVLLRMEILLARIAGQALLEAEGEDEQRRAFAELVDCEAFRLDDGDDVAPETLVAGAETYPRMAEEQAVLDDVMPAWMGIRYRPLREHEQKPRGVGKGAVAVLTVYPGSPAEEAGLQPGDVLLGPPDDPFDERHEVREWTMRREVGTIAPLEVLRDDERRRIALRPGPFPVEVPELPGPPDVGSPAPELQVEPVLGSMRANVERPRMLFFWATWCAICHSSLPELLAFAEARGVEIVAISDEDPEKVREFIDNFPGEFPETVVVDRFRSTFQSYGVSGTPTFVLVDAAGDVQHYQTGYNPKTGLDVDGWDWTP